MCDKNTWLPCAKCRRLPKDDHDHDKVACEHEDKMQPEIKGDYPEAIVKRIADGVLMAKSLRLIPPAPLAKQDCEVEWFEDGKGFPDWKIKHL